jgi:hypothetical protein
MPPMETGSEDTLKEIRAWPEAMTTSGTHEARVAAMVNPPWQGQ